MKLTTKTLAVAAAVGALASSNALAVNFSITYEAPGAVNTTTGFDYSGFETFEGRGVGTNKTFTTDYGLNAVAPVQISGEYKGVEIRNADQFGGAGGTGQYAVALRTGSKYEVSLSTSTSKGLNYFGYWLSALDAGNTVTFYDGLTNLGTYDATSVLADIVAKGNPDYFGNPFAPFEGNNSKEPYAFINFYANDGVTFDRIVFEETKAANGGYESDNHTVGYYNEKGGVSPIPEPSTYALMFGGLAAVSFMARRRNAKV